MSKSLHYGSIARGTAWLLPMLALCLFYGLLVHGAIDTMYKQYGPLGEPHRLMVDVERPLGGEAGPGARSHMGNMAYLWSEGAFHYRASLMFAVDNYQPPELLANDWWHQYPDGVDAWAEYSLFMEPLYGLGYRVFGRGQAFIDYMLAAVVVVACATLLGVFFAARGCGAHGPYAFLAPLTYATCTLGFSRLLVSPLLKETMGIMILAWLLVAWARVIRQGGRAAGILAGLGTAALLASWHFGQFIVLMVSVALLACELTAPRPPANTWRSRALMPPIVTVVAFLVAGSAIPALRENGALVGIPALFAYAWAGVALARVKYGALRSPLVYGAAVIGLLVVLTAAAKTAGFSHGSEFGHVYELALAKLAHPFGKPDDPSRISFAARMFWVPPFTSPGYYLIWLRLGLNGLLVIPAAAAVVVLAMRARDGALPLFVSLLAVVTFGVWMFGDRFGPLFLVPGCLAVSLLVSSADSVLPRDRSYRSRIAAGVVWVVCAANVYVNMGDIVKISRSRYRGNVVKLTRLDDTASRSRAEMYRWITANTPGPGSAASGGPAAFVGDIGDSPQLLLYAGRPIVLNSQFENLRMRERYRSYLEAMYSLSESSVWEFMARYRAEYLFINKEWGRSQGTNSPLYMSGKGARLDPRMPAVRMCSEPHGLRRFELVFDNDHYRVFRRTPR